MADRQSRGATNKDLMEMSTKPRPTLQPGETRAFPVLPLRDIVVFRT